MTACDVIFDTLEIVEDTKLSGHGLTRIVEPFPATLHRDVLVHRSVIFPLRKLDLDRFLENRVVANIVSIPIDRATDNHIADIVVQVKFRRDQASGSN